VLTVPAFAALVDLAAAVAAFAVGFAALVGTALAGTALAGADLRARAGTARAEVDSARRGEGTTGGAGERSPSGSRTVAADRRRAPDRGVAEGLVLVTSLLRQTRTSASAVRIVRRRTGSGAGPVLLRASDGREDPVPHADANWRTPISARSTVAACRAGNRCATCSNGAGPR